MSKACAAKRIGKARHLTAHGAPVEAATRIDKQSVLPIMVYVAQLAEPPLLRLCAIERNSLHSSREFRVCDMRPRFDVRQRVLTRLNACAL